MRLSRIIYLVLALTSVLFALNRLADNLTTKDTGTGQTAPVINENFVLKPIYRMETKGLKAGMAFAVKEESMNTPIIITAMHIFGPLGGLERNIPANELPDYLSSVELLDAYNETNVGTADRVLVIKDAEPYSTNSINKDLAAFVAASDAELTPGKFCEKAPYFGDTVWLAAPIVEGNSIQQRLHKGIVTMSNERELDFKFEDQSISINATSGAPILNNKGEIVGVNIGAKRVGANLIGVANPAASVKKLLNEALKQPLNVQSL